MLIAALFLVASISYGQTASTNPPAPVVGSLLGQVTFRTNCGYIAGVGSGVGIGMTFDGKNLWYSCDNSKLATVSATDLTPAPNDLYKADPATGAVLAGYNIQGGTGAIAYDATRNVIWAAEGAGYNDKTLWPADNQFTVIVIPLDNQQNVAAPTCATPPCPSTTPLYKVAFPVIQAYQDPIATTASTENVADGLAIDTATDTLYIHYDFGPNIYMYNATTGAYLGSIPQAPGIPAGTPVISNPFGAGWPAAYGAGCVVSGLAIGGKTLIEASDYCDWVWAVDSATQSASFNFGFASSVSSFSGFDEKALTCDTKTFGAGDAIWVKEPYDSQTAYAFMIPTGSCGIGGQPAKSNKGKHKGTGGV
jgi:hypothetical protein